MKSQVTPGTISFDIKLLICLILFLKPTKNIIDVGGIMFDILQKHNGKTAMKYYLPFVFTILLNCSPVLAEQISIELSTRIQHTPRYLSIEVDVLNTGTATAYGATVKLKTSEGTYPNAKISDVLPGKTANFSFVIPTGSLPHGTYPVVALCDFKDAGGYPFSALNATTFVVEPACDPIIKAAMSDFPVTQFGETTLKLRNPTSLVCRADIQLILPYEFSAKKEQTLVMPPQSKKNLRLNITNNSALSGATYPFFCLIQYDAKGCHHTLIKKNTIHVKKIPSDNLFYVIRWNLLSGFMICLAAIFIVATLKNKFWK